MSTATGPRPLGVPVGQSEPVRRRAVAPAARSPRIGGVVRAAGVVAIIGLAVLAVTRVSAAGELGLALRCSIVVMTLDLLISWAFVEAHLNPRRPTAARKSS